MPEASDERSISDDERSQVRMRNTDNTGMAQELIDSIRFSAWVAYHQAIIEDREFSFIFW